MFVYLCKCKFIYDSSSIMLIVYNNVLILCKWMFIYVSVCLYILLSVCLSMLVAVLSYGWYSL